MSKHTNTGNCYAKAYRCKECGKGNLCDVCHEHECPRGECDDCQKCAACDEANR
jgi:hypothetical protein